MESAHQFSFRPDCNNTAEVPSFTLRTALSAIPFVSDPWGVDVQWFQKRSSQTLPNSKELSVQMTLGFLFGSKNFCKLLWVSCEVFVLHGCAWIHWVAKSFKATACRWLFRDSHCHWGPSDLLSSSHQNFQHEVRAHHCVPCTGPLFLSSGRSRNFRL